MGCRQANPIPPTILGQIDGQRVCGKRADFNFLTAKRPVKEKGVIKCPEKYTHCGDPGDLKLENWFEEFKDNIICVQEGKQNTDCPITGIDFTPGPDFGRTQEPTASADRKPAEIRSYSKTTDAE